MKRNDYTFILDVDGVFTTGHFLYSIDGKQFKVFGPHDNDGLKMIKGTIPIKLITADKRGYDITHKRVVEDMHQDLELVNEMSRYEYISNKYRLDRVIYMGDGIFDAPILKDCYFGIAPKNARIEARHAADYVTPSKSGEGAVLDACLKVIEILSLKK